MNLSTLTIGRRVALGFSLLLLLGAGLGGFAAWSMNRDTVGARFLSDAVAPQAEVASNLAKASALAQRSARTYGLTGDTNELAAARKHLDEVNTALGNARKLSTAQPSLTFLAENIGPAEKAYADYVAQVDATVANLEHLSKIRASLDANGAKFLEDAYAYIAPQDKALAEEIAAGAPAAQIEARRAVLVVANQLVDSGNFIRIAAFKAQALRQPELIEKAMPLFDNVESSRQKLLASTKVDSQRKDLEALGTAVANYKAGIEAILKNYAEASTIASTRIAAATEFDRIVDTILERSIGRTLGYAKDSASSMASTARLVLIGLVVMIATGIVAAWLIIRGVNTALTRAAETLTQGALQVAAASGQVSSASQTLAEGSSEQAASLEEISSSVEELTSMTKRNADNAQAGKTSAGHARAAAENGATEMERMQSAMNAIQQSSTDISKIIKTIDEIAFQTNILALNAAVEAARAGEAGAGFAVVADEVRSLAQRSAVAAKETADKIADATQRSAQGVELSTRVSAGLREIVAKAREVDQLIAEVATASHEQSEGLMQINSAIGQMDKVTQSNAASAEETASAAEELNGQSVELRSTAEQLAALVGASATAHEGAAHAAPAAAPRAARVYKTTAPKAAKHAEHHEPTHA